MNPSYGLNEIAKVVKRVQENNKGELLILRNEQSEITEPRPLRDGKARE